MKIILNAIVEIFCSNEILKEKDVSHVRNLHTLLIVLGDCNKSAFSDEEKRFLYEVNEFLEKRDFNRVERLDVPSSLKAFHKTLLKVLPFLKELDKKIYH